MDNPRTPEGNEVVWASYAKVSSFRGQTVYRYTGLFSRKPQVPQLLRDDMIMASMFPVPKFQRTIDWQGEKNGTA